jgi:hypothetical protein
MSNMFRVQENNSPNRKGWAQFSPEPKSLFEVWIVQQPGGWPNSLGSSVASMSGVWVVLLDDGTVDMGNNMANYTYL